MPCVGSFLSGGGARSRTPGCPLHAGDGSGVYGRDMRDFRSQSEKTRLDRVLQAFAQTRVGGWLFIHVLPRIDRPLLRLSRGRLSTGAGQTYVLLHALGARSGIERTTPLLGTKFGDAILLVASKAGAPQHPAWFHNVRANPDVSVTVDGERRAMRARVAGREERDRLWAVVCDHYSGYAAYQSRTHGRVIPVVVLEAR
jgi:deazaflavin-dependent oxidoreductase (nitroreductase family)